MKYFAPLVYDNFIFTDIDECSDNNGGCSEQCVNTDESYHCTCKTGYKLEDDKKTCVGKFIILFLIAYSCQNVVPKCRLLVVCVHAEV